MAAGAVPGSRLGVQLPGSAGAAAGAHKAIVPARLKPVPDAGRLMWKTNACDDKAGVTAFPRSLVEFRQCS
jgi:hypothetical protein